MAKEEEQKKRDYKSGKQFGISGREMFSFNPELADDGDMDDGDTAFDSYAREEDDDDNAVEYKELDFDALGLVAQEVDGTGTVATDDRLKGAAAEPEPEEQASAQDVVDATPFNENLFLDEDLEGLDEQLNDLDLDDDDSGKS